MPVRFTFRVVLLVAYVLADCSAAIAQTENAQPAPSTPPVLFVPATTCNPWIIQTLPTELSFRQRFCLELAHLASPATFIETATITGYSQWRNSPLIEPHDADDFSLRLGYLYERQAARGTAELFVSYLHHEDLRPHPSNKQGFWLRTGAALLTVLASPGENGNGRVALAPIAGALGSGLTSMALYPRQDSLMYGLERSGLSYSGYFARALIHEFSPEFWSLTPRFIRKHHQALSRAFTL